MGLAQVSRTAVTLDLQLLGWGETEGLQLADVLRSFTALTELDLRGNAFGEASAKRLATAVVGHATLRTFNGIDADSRRAWPLPSGSLDVLDLRRIRSGDVLVLELTAKRVGDTGALVISEVLPGMSALRELRLGGKNFLLAANFLYPDSEGNEITDVGATALARALLECPGVTVVDLSCNRIGAAGAREMAEVVRRSKSLVRLNLGGNEHLFGTPHDAVRRPRQKGPAEQSVAHALATAVLANGSNNGSLVSLVLGPNAGAPYRWADDKRLLRHAVRGRPFELVLFSGCLEVHTAGESTGCQVTCVLS